MKRIAVLLLLLILCVTGCASVIDATGDDAGEVILRISSDPEPYLGKTVRLSGYCATQEFMGIHYHYVLQETADGSPLGFEIRSDEEIPADGTPVLVTGILMTETVYGQAYIYLRVSEISVLKAAE